MIIQLNFFLIGLFRFPIVWYQMQSENVLLVGNDYIIAIASDILNFKSEREMTKRFVHDGNEKRRKNGE